MGKPRIVRQKIKWEVAPTLRRGFHPEIGQVAVIGEPRRATIQPKYRGSMAVDLSSFIVAKRVFYLNHKTKILAKVRGRYRDAGFATRIILQDPTSHQGPTTACTIGFLTSLPRNLWANDLRVFKRFVCRVHADLASLPNGMIVSVPHIEPDPIFHWKEHLEYAAIRHKEVKGPPAVKILHYFLKM